MNAIDSFPCADMPLRAKLPLLSPETRSRLIHWGETQPGSLPWLISRSAAYWDKFAAPDGASAPDEHYMLLDATASLDLLRHRTQATGDREAVEHLIANLDVKESSTAKVSEAVGKRTQNLRERETPADFAVPHPPNNKLTDAGTKTL